MLLLICWYACQDTDIDLQEAAENASRPYLCAHANDHSNSWRLVNDGRTKRIERCTIGSSSTSWTWQISDKVNLVIICCLLPAMSFVFSIYMWLSLHLRLCVQSSNVYAFKTVKMSKVCFAGEKKAQTHIHAMSRAKWSSMNFQLENSPSFKKSSHRRIYSISTNWQKGGVAKVRTPHSVIGKCVVSCINKNEEVSPSPPLHYRHHHTKMSRVKINKYASIYRSIGKMVVLRPRWHYLPNVR